MTPELNLIAVLLAAFVASASPGPATLAIAGTSLSQGRRAGLAVASGITLGSLTWSVSAALGMGALMVANAWMFETVRYIGAAYLLWLAVKSARSALSRKPMEPRSLSGTHKRQFAKGLALHLTNPKAVLFFGALYAIGLPSEATIGQLATVIACIGVQSFVVFHGYAILFSTPQMARGYIRLRRWFEGAFAIGFGLAGIRILTAKLP